MTAFARPLAAARVAARFAIGALLLFGLASPALAADDPKAREIR